MLGVRRWLKPGSRSAPWDAMAMIGSVGIMDTLRLRGVTFSAVEESWGKKVFQDKNIQMSPVKPCVGK